MLKTKSQFERIIALDQQIRAGKYPNCRSFAKQHGIEVSERTVGRDIEYLKDRLQAPLKYDFVRKGFYYTEQTWSLPSLSLSEGELFAVLVASQVLKQYQGTPIAGKLEAVFEKIASALPDKMRLNPALIYNRFSFTNPPAKPVSEKIWTAIVNGLTNQRSVKIAYKAMESAKEKERLIDPYHIANLQGEWYVFAFDHRAEDVSQFAIPRINEATTTEKGFEMPEDFDPEKYLTNAFGRFATNEAAEQVRLRFDKEVAPWVLEREWHPKQKVKKLSDGGVELTFPVAKNGLFEVFRWVLSWGRHVRVIDPLRLREMVEDEVGKMTRNAKANRGTNAD